jgi:short subunit dehydrogenase-like uncharacterized protein
MSNVWILGGAGRAGRAIARDLVMSGLPVTLVGRDAGTLRNAAASPNIDLGIVATSSLADMAPRITRAKPSGVINTIDPFTKTAILFVNACPPGEHPSFLTQVRREAHPWKFSVSITKAMVS